MFIINLFKCCWCEAAPSSAPLSKALVPTVEKATKLPENISQLIAEYAIPRLLLDTFPLTHSWKVPNLLENLWEKIDLKDKNIDHEYNYNDVLDLVKNYLKDPKVWSQIPTYKDIRIAVVSNDRLQGIVIYTALGYDKKSWKILALISAPWNVQKTGERCEGVGTALLNYVTAQAKNTSNLETVKLRASSSAVTFYQHAGFQCLDDQNNMHLTIK